jgi:putative ABC transport system permease protein
VSLAELVRTARASLRAHKLRSFLTLLGIIIGVTTVVGVASVISGLNRYVQDKVIRLAPDVYVITKFGIIRSREEFLDALKRARKRSPPT